MIDSLTYHDSRNVDNLPHQFRYMATSPPQNNSMAGNSNSNHSSNSMSGFTTSSNQSTSNRMTANSGENQQSLGKPRLSELAREVDVTTQLDEDVEEMLMEVSDDFLGDVIKTTCEFAKHRKSSKVEVRDAQLLLERKWNLWIPGFGTDELRPYKRSVITEAHKQRLALIRKTIKKY